MVERESYRDSERVHDLFSETFGISFDPARSRGMIDAHGGKNMNEPLIKGGQGRDESEIRQAARDISLSILAGAIVIAVAILGAL